MFAVEESSPPMWMWQHLFGPESSAKKDIIAERKDCTSLDYDYTKCFLFEEQKIILVNWLPNYFIV